MAILLYLMFWLAASSAHFVDYLQTFEPECLTEGAFTCLSGGCVAQEKYCDGNYDCEDGSDENFCFNHRPDEQYCNDTHQFLCADSLKCLPSAWVCNDEVDCKDGSDEANCPSTVISDNTNSKCKGFLCDGKKCISSYWKCDGYYDCDDKTDEDIKTACRHVLHSKPLHDLYLHDISYCENRGRYTCLDKSFCLPPEHMCDGTKDCKDGSDEGAFCNRWHTMCKNFTCPQNSECMPQRSGATCLCETYKRYNSTSKQCEETDHCMEEKPVCSHMCENKGDHFQCVCDVGYTTDIAKYLCFAPDPEALLFFSTRNDIRYISVKSKNEVIVTTGIKQAHAVSYDGDHLYWVENAEGHQAIMRARLDDVKDSKQVIAALGLEAPGDIAIDFLGDNIYFSDVQRGVISACRSDGSACVTLRTRCRRPRYVTLDPRQGKMYWVDHHDREVIMQARMDGSQAEVLVDHLESAPTGLALDAPNGRLYYVDRTIKVIRLKDKMIYSFFEEPLHHPYSLAVFENTVYWSDLTSDTIQSTHKIHGTNTNRNILLRLDVPVFDMHLYHPVLVNKARNPCGRHECTICLVTSDASHACACPDHMHMIDGRCEHVPGYRPQYLVVGSGATFTRVLYNHVGNPETHGAHLDIGRVQAMAYDSIRDALYIYDGQHKSISRINMSDFMLGVTELLLYKGLENVVDMDYDVVSDTLYVLDAGRRVIEVVSLRNRHSALLYSFRDQEIPLSLCVMSDYGRMLVAVLEIEENNKVHIDTMGLDGTKRDHLILNNVIGPNVRLRYSQEMNVVYVADEGSGVIDVIHPEGSGREIFSEVPSTVASLAVSDTHVFWTDRHSPRLYWASVHEASHKTHRVRRMELSIFPNQTHLHILTTSSPPGPKNPYRQHKCFQPPTPCSHICVQAPHTHNNVMGYSCRCPPGFLTFDQCMEFVECRPEEFYCHRSIQCFAADKKCDGVKDCKFGEDEEGCVNQTFTDAVTQKPATCPADMTNCDGICIPKTQECQIVSTTAPISEPLKCNAEEIRCSDNSACIDRSLACDGHSDCRDGSDEHPDACDVRTCMHTEFMCAIGKCIPIAWKCDRNEDCPDGSDEVGCDTSSCPEGSFQCGNGSCVAVYQRCDGKSDCADHADEEGCDLSEFIEVSERVITCSPWEHTCERNRSMCLPLTARCNGRADCPGGTDEDGCDFHCGGAGGALFPCRQEYKCVKRSRVCNGRRDCSDGSDETIEACLKVNKTMPIPIAHPVRADDCSSGYRCDNAQCVEWAQVCDNTTDCADASDEGALCGKPCQPDTCQQSCHVTPRGPACTCAHGYVTHGSTCRDVDECAQRPCSHACHNTIGSFACSCHRGYALRLDSRSCKALHGAFSVVYTEGHSIWSASHHLYDKPLYSDLGAVNHLDVDVRNKKVYVTIGKSSMLLQLNLTKQDTRNNEITNIGVPDKVAVDWITGNVYFVDAKPSAGYVRVCHFQRRRCARLQQLPRDATVTALTLDPANRLMFYCTRAGHETAVHSASLSGRNVSLVAPADACSGLAADGFSRRLYVASEHPSGILEIDYDGTPKTSFGFTNKDLHSPRGMALFEDHVYFLSGSRLSRCMLFGPKMCDSYEQINATSFAIHHESVQRDDISNDCEANVCANVCVLGPTGPECVCHDGSLSTDGTCPIVKTTELALFNGWTYQEYKSHSVSYALVATVLVLFALYLALFVYQHFVRKRNTDYLQVRYKNQPDAVTQIPSPFIEIPDSAGYNMGSDPNAHEFVNPLQFVRNYWQESFYKKKPIGTAGLTFDAQQNLSDTESDLDVRERSAMINNNTLK